MKKTIALMVVASFVTASSGFAAGPIEISAKREASRLAQQSSGTPGSKGRAMTWTGVGLIGGGIALIAVANGPAKHSECKNILSGTSVIGKECEEGTNMALGLTGLGVAVLGTVLTIAGIHKDVTVGARSIALRLKF